MSVKSVKELVSIAVFFAVLAISSSTDGVTSAGLSGDIHVHDPSLIKQDKTYYLFSTGNSRGEVNQGNIQIRKSSDLLTWEFVGTVFADTPEWIVTALGFKPPSLWAPDISYFNGRYHLYYAGSRFGTNNSVIGLATNITLDPASATYKWIDQGQVIRSTSSDNWNAIDPNLSFDTENNPWLTLGSFWEGIKMRRLEMSTGKLSLTDSTLYSVASRGGGPIEAPAIVLRKKYYYLFVSFDFCCRGARSTYKIMVGRATNITGPYIARSGQRLDQGGGDLILAGEGRYCGPGGQSVYVDGRTYRLVYHYYDAADNGRQTLQIRNLSWTADDWPVVGAPLGERAEAR